MAGSGKYGFRLLGILLFAATVLPASVASAAKAPPFEGKWAYANKCGSGHYLGINLRQSGDRVSGNWSEGTNVHGGDGKLEGQLRGKKLYVRYCSDDEEVGYADCPEFSGDEDYFRVDRGMLVRYKKYGSSYVRTVALYPDVIGKDVPLVEECLDEEGGP
ncbi:hypothetical protein [Xanthomonas sp. 1678]|uniref:hypothetical protein n=1 Tax=Xanthomonas sp. 1678 TaxID=3158788 RepID=UPI002859F03F|nr:hypothetical protein [Xanthomonas translucens]